MNRVYRIIQTKLFPILLSLLCPIFLQATEDEVEILDIEIVSYDALKGGCLKTIETVKKALYEDGIVGVRAIPSFQDKVNGMLKTSKEFYAYPEYIKEKCARIEGEAFRGYERGKEDFLQEDGTRVVDDLKCSFYAFVPDGSYNIWPENMDLKTSFVDLANLMKDAGFLILEHLGLIGTKTGIYLDDALQLGRLLYYQKKEGSEIVNPNWCGAHFDHSMFTVLVPARYYLNDKQVDEPEEAGLFIKSKKDGVYRKVISNDPDVLMFQVGEFGQIISNDGIRATKHLVRKAKGEIERYTMALFFDLPMDTVVHSTSVLTSDPRYSGSSGDPCSYKHWNDATFNLNLVREDK